MKIKKMPTAKFLPTKLKELREAHYPDRGGASTIAKTLGFPPAAWSQYESGKSMPYLPRQQQIADFFGITLAELRGENQTALDLAEDGKTTHATTSVADYDKMVAENKELRAENERLRGEAAKAQAREEILERDKEKLLKRLLEAERDLGATLALHDKKVLTEEALTRPQTV